MPELNKQWALNEIDEFLHSSERVHTPAPNRSSDVKWQRDNDVVVARHAEVVERIVNQLTPGWRSTVPSSQRHRWDQLREAASRARAMLERDDEVRLYLGDAPSQHDSESKNAGNGLVAAAHRRWSSGGLHRPGTAKTVGIALASFAAVAGFIITYTQYIQSTGWLSAIVLAAAVLAGLIALSSIFSRPGRSRNFLFLSTLCANLACTAILLSTPLSPFVHHDPAVPTPVPAPATAATTSAAPTTNAAAFPGNQIVTELQAPGTDVWVTNLNLSDQENSFQVRFTYLNRADEDAHNVFLATQIPAGLEPIPGTARLYSSRSSAGVPLDIADSARFTHIDDFAPNASASLQTAVRIVPNFFPCEAPTTRIFRGLITAPELNEGEVIWGPEASVTKTRKCTKSGS